MRSSLMRPTIFRTPSALRRGVEERLLAGMTLCVEVIGRPPFFILSAAYRSRLGTGQHRESALQIPYRFDLIAGGRKRGRGETMKIVGYADRFSVMPGESIRFMVSCDGISTYRADIVRLIHGDTN